MHQLLRTITLVVYASGDRQQTERNREMDRRKGAHMLKFYKEGMFGLFRNSKME
jgi:hypothetical protein